MAIYREPGRVIYTGDDRRDVLVLVDDAWWAGELRSWDRATDGTWSAMVTWSRGPGTSHYLERFPADRIRPDEDHLPGVTADRGST